MTTIVCIFVIFVYFYVAYTIKRDLINDRDFDRYPELWITLASVFWVISIPLAILYVIMESGKECFLQLFGTMRNK